MINFLLHALKSFRSCFSRSKPWVIFCMVVISFIGSTEMVGVTSICRFWGLGENGYDMLLHFFRSSAWSLSSVVLCWQAFLISQKKLVTIDGRVVLQGDHTYVPKDGQRMPGVVTLHQDSETQSKPSYFRGHCWGAIVALAGSLCAPFGIPLNLGIHQGFVHIGSGKSKEKMTMGPQIFHMALDFCLNQNVICILTLDAFFPSKLLFNLANSIWSIKFRKPVVSLIVRAKKNFVAYFEAENIPGAQGRPKKYGMKVVLMELFDHMDMFEKLECCVYGKTEEVFVLALNLLWRPTGDFVRFILVYSSRGPIVLMCNDLQMQAETAIQLYCARTRIEIAFDMLKNLIGAFRYRFWSKGLPLHSRKPKKNEDLKEPSKSNVKNVIKCWAAIERFVMIGAIALGLLQLVSIKFQNTVWNHFNLYLRTRSRQLPSERTVKHVLSSFLGQIILKVAASGIMREIQSLISDKNSL